MSPSSLASEAVGAGPPLLLLHAFPFSREMWRPQWESLSDTFRVVAFDLPGFGNAPLPAGGWTMDSAADAVARWLDHNGVTGPVTLGGLSMGGYVALAFARRHPNRLRALILADTRAEPDSDETKAGRNKTAELAKAEGTAAVVDQVMPKLLGEHTRAHRPDVVAEVRRIGVAQPAEAVVAALMAMRDRPDSRPSLPANRVPTLVLVGAEDMVTPPSAARVLADGIPGAKLVTLPTAGHMSNLETPAAFTAAVREFLDNLPATT